jgi:hypothetical protein
MKEVKKGYPHHVWYAMGHMAEAEDELQGFLPAEAELVRVERKELEASAGDWKVPHFRTLMYAVAHAAMLEELQEKPSLIDKLRVRARHSFSVLFDVAWQHEDTGRMVLLPFWKNPGRRWYRCGLKE